MSEKVSLKEFIDKNYTLITSIGVAAALTALFTRLEYGEYLAFISFMMFVLLATELWTLFPSVKDSSLKLRLFENLSLLLVSLLGLYVFTSYTEYFLGYLPIAFMVLFWFTAFIYLQRSIQKTTKKEIVKLFLLVVSGFLLGYFLGYLLLITF